MSTYFNKFYYTSTPDVPLSADNMTNYCTSCATLNVEENVCVANCSNGFFLEAQECKSNFSNPE